jgi:hypothetical protein
VGVLLVLAKAGEPFENRALPLDTLKKPYKQYEVIKPIPESRQGKQYLGLVKQEKACNMSYHYP